MTTTTQSLSGGEQGDYLTIQKNVEDRGTPEEKAELKELQAEIVNELVSENPAIQGEIANRVRAGILNSAKWKPFLR